MPQQRLLGIVSAPNPLKSSIRVCRPAIIIPSSVITVLFVVRVQECGNEVVQRPIKFSIVVC